MLQEVSSEQSPTAWDTGNHRNEGGLEAIEKPVASPEPIEIEPAQAEVNIDTWFAQRDIITKKLLQRRQELFQEIAETNRRLELLGVEVEPAKQDERPAPRVTTRNVRPKTARPTAAKPMVARVPGSIASAAKVPPQPTKRGGHQPNGAMKAVLGAMVPRDRATIEDIEKRTNLPHKVVYGALKYALTKSRVRRSQSGKTVLWALA